MSSSILSPEGNMTSLRCKDYGYECNFQTDGETEKVVIEFRNHSIKNHGIDYGVEALGHFIRRKYPEKKIKNPK